ncbi:plasmid stabilization protein [Psychromonas sp. Urea-02u-13]|uniref:plasmid stabilization protein n=1 Tax=Psychromonas sp. Urea-02u-13 TaxID=2058326 RepID=UPI000C32B790|nr:plasmid stabilization protein [Psychromonas sp. Urea-02u-13]PKG36998.1 plasmid stabilization protein [Psychromonas sp. Urea-02u-13]
MSQVTIEYTETFSNSTDLAIMHLMRWNDELSVLDKVESTVDTFESAVNNNPLIYPVSPNLFDVAGISSIREANINGFKLLYEAEEQGEETLITALLLLGQKQSVKEQLTQHCLMYR